jgi:nitrous oxidase accessory protein
MRRASLGLVAAMLALPAALAAQATIVVSPEGPVRTVAEGVRLAAPGGRVLVRAGTYREPTIIVDKPLTIAGEGWPTLDGQGAREIMTVIADDVTVRGMRFAHVGSSHVEDRAALRVRDASGCTIEDNRIDDGFFGIYLARATKCRVAGNVLRGVARTEESTGNGIHLWSSNDVVVERNQVSGHRDGIYFEFVRDASVRHNLSERNLRYGLHFMYSDDCHYLDNVFRHNTAGVAVMYTKNVEMRRNRFEDAWGGAAYGLLLKEIYDPVLDSNRFARNSIGLLADGAVRLVATGNEFSGNGWAVQLMANSSESRFERNVFAGNTFDVSTNSRTSDSRFAGNFWDEYAGYDLDRDGVGDVPHHPVRLFSLIVAGNEPSLILLRSLFVRLLDAAERVLPALTPETLVDATPAMRRPS